VNDAYVAKPNASGTALIYSSYLGGYNGIASEIGYGIAVDGNSTAHVVGYTSTSAFPTTASAFQPSYGGGADDGLFGDFRGCRVSTGVQVQEWGSAWRTA